MKLNLNRQMAVPLIFACLFLLCSCSVKKQDDRTTITYFTMESLPEQRWALEKMVEKFEEENPGIHVKVEHSSSGFQKLKILMAGGDAPDVFYFTSDRMPALINRNRILNLNPFIEKEEKLNLNHYYPEVVKSCEIDGNLYLFPFHFSTDLLFYNKDLFDQAGLDYPNENWTWDDYLQAAQKLTLKSNGRIVQYGTLQPRTLLMVRSLGGDCFDKELNQVVINSEQTKEALQFLVNLEKKYHVVPSPGQIRDMEKEDGLDLFSTGKVAMYVGRTYMVSELSKISRFDWDVSLVPKGKIRYSRLAVGGNCISKNTAHPEEAWKFVKYYSSYEGSRICGLSRNCVPALKLVAESDLFLYEPPKGVKHLIGSLKFSEIENYGLLNWDEFFQKSFKAETDKVLFGVKTIEDCLEDISREGVLALEQNKKIKKL